MGFSTPEIKENLIAESGRAKKWAFDTGNRGNLNCGVREGQEVGFLTPEIEEI